jgi:hypothetical protein
MLYINENEKKHIKSLYYTKVINEQYDEETENRLFA